MEDGDLQTLGMLDYDKRLSQSFTAHPKIDPFTEEMFTFGYSITPPYVTYRVITKDGIMLDPLNTIPEPVMMHDFTVTENYAILMDLFKLLARMKVYITDEEELIMEPSLKWAGNPNVIVAVKAFGRKATVQLVVLQVFAAPRITLVPSFPCFSKMLVSLNGKGVQE